MPTRTLKFHVVAEMSVDVETVKGELCIVDSAISNPRLATKPEDEASDQDLATIMANKEALIELGGVLLVQHVMNARNPKVKVPR